ncbi:hypothetical protein CB4_00114 [Aneurinibacillus soli]|uniref:Uncharacterized protein n=1 Tax=Aneurinibacillus soli TaxID=1500254 RepID=A0A0U5AQE7_9BACL|nr:hypothetical protein CB4_00114 [Aneurinibacillus soli]
MFSRKKLSFDSGPASLLSVEVVFCIFYSSVSAWFFSHLVLNKTMALSFEEKVEIGKQSYSLARR